jgi:dsDNA-binding SOS-regulon protein
MNKLERIKYKILRERDKIMHYALRIDREETAYDTMMKHSQRLNKYWDVYMKRLKQETQTIINNQDLEDRI